jgi:hypothetical protein
MIKNLIYNFKKRGGGGWGWIKRGSGGKIYIKLDMVLGWVES